MVSFILYGVRPRETYRNVGICLYGSFKILLFIKQGGWKLSSGTKYESKGHLQRRSVLDATGHF